MTFEEILPALRNGEIVRREAYSENLIIFMQNPAYIPIDYIQRMQSLPNKAKELLNKFECPIWYKDQLLIYDFYTNSKTSIKAINELLLTKKDNIKKIISNFIKKFRAEIRFISQYSKNYK